MVRFKNIIAVLKSLIKNEHISSKTNIVNLIMHFKLIVYKIVFSNMTVT